VRADAFNDAAAVRAMPASNSRSRAMQQRGCSFQNEYDE